GLNHIRFHSWCPPEAAFVAADELGFYYHVECSAWTTVGNGGPFDQWLYKESEAMVKAYGNHPSFVMMAYGNEPGGPNQKRFLGDFVAYWQKKDPRRLYTSAAGWPMIPENDYHSTPAPRIQQWGEGVKSRVNAKPSETMTDYSEFIQQHSDAPVISHEIGQWCVYPNFDEMKKYTGLLKPKNFEIFREQLDRNGMLYQARDFLLASGKLQTLLYKEDIESALRTPGFGGFQLLDLHDFPGQGTALVGVLDPFWDSKPYVTPKEYHRFCGPTVPLARLPRRIFESGDTLVARIDVAHFGAADLKDATPAWTLRDSTGEIVESGQFPRRTIKTGELSVLGEVKAPMYVAREADKFSLEVTIPGADAANDWDLWVFPKSAPAEPDDEILIAQELGDEAIAHLAKGGKVLLLPSAVTIRNDEKHPIQMGFSSIFWNTVWTNWQAPHTLGILCDPKHPALRQFPTEFHTNWQWWELIHGAAPFILTEHRDLKPVVQVIDDWVTARKLALIFEVRVGHGKLLACSSDLTNDLDKRPVARQMRRSLLAYMDTDQFSPRFNMTVEQLRGLFREPSPLQKLGAVAVASNHHPSHGPDLAIDGNPSTIWHTNWEPMAQPPHHLILDLKKPVRIRGLTVLPRQDMTNGRIARFELYASVVGKPWGEPIASGQWPNDAQLKTIRLEEPVEARFLKLVALSEVQGRPFAAVAEVDILLE
ncbi:MAG TPA: discoidin domain-containing protein, partial [Sedimentisphaerales bacterium]|nr:discoidin domain-containing protein [Sedimentisphaerales bacterium]